MADRWADIQRSYESLAETNKNMGKGLTTPILDWAKRNRDYKRELGSLDKAGEIQGGLAAAQRAWEGGFKEKELAQEDTRNEILRTQGEEALARAQADAIHNQMMYENAQEANRLRAGESEFAKEQVSKEDTQGIPYVFDEALAAAAERLGYQINTSSMGNPAPVLTFKDEASQQKFLELFLIEVKNKMEEFAVPPEAISPKLAEYEKTFRAYYWKSDFAITPVVDSTEGGMKNASRIILEDPNFSFSEAIQRAYQMISPFTPVTEVPPAVKGDVNVEGSEAWAYDTINKLLALDKEDDTLLTDSEANELGKQQNKLSRIVIGHGGVTRELQDVLDYIYQIQNKLRPSE